MIVGVVVFRLDNAIQTPSNVCLRSRLEPHRPCLSVVLPTLAFNAERQARDAAIKFSHSIVLGNEAAQAIFHSHSKIEIVEDSKGMPPGCETQKGEKDWKAWSELFRKVPACFTRASLAKRWERTADGAW